MAKLPHTAIEEMLLGTHFVFSRSPLITRPPSFLLCLRLYLDCYRIDGVVEDEQYENMIYLPEGLALTYSLLY